MSHSSTIKATIFNLNAQFNDETPILNVCEEPNNIFVITTTDNEVVEDVAYAIDELFAQQYQELSIDLEASTIRLVM